MTYKKAMDDGYVVYETRYYRGYLSRKPGWETRATLQIAGGNRKGEIFFELPNFDSTRYYKRVYVKAP